MLDNGTKKRIDSARDILVGKVPDPKSQVEQITIAMIYKFMDDMDNQTEELGGKATFFAGEFKQYAWSRLLDRKFSGHERLLLYAEGIEKMNMNENVPQLFRDIFKGAFLPYRDPETLNLFLKEINGFAYDHSERLGDAFEYLLSVLSSQGDAGQFRTPRHIIDCIVGIVNPAKEDTVLDPACGTAGFLISSYKHILNQNTKIRIGDLLTTDDKGRLMTNFCGYDISPDMVRLSLVNMYLHSFANPAIYEYDTLTSENRWDERYDVILANPPFMSPKGGIRPHSRFTIKAKRSEVLFVDYIAEHLNVHGRAGVIVPEGIIFQSQNAYKNLRKMLVDEGYLHAVISLPAGVFQPYSGVKTSILFMDKTLAKKTDEILFVKVSNDGFDLGAQRRTIDKNDLPQALQIVKNWQQAISQGKGLELSEDDKTIAHTVSKEKIAESGDYNLYGDRYRENKFTYFGDYTEIAIGEALDIQSGFAFESKRFNETQGFPVIRIRDIKTNHTKTKYDGDYDDEFNAVIWQGGQALLNQRVCRFLNYRSCIKEYVYRLIQRKLKEIEDNTYAVTVKHISVKQISAIKIPLPPLEVQEKIVAELDGYQKIIDGAKQIVENYKPTIKIDPDWPMVRLGEMCRVESGFGFPVDEQGLTDEDIPFVKVGDMNLLGNERTILSARSTISRTTAKRLKAEIFPIGTVVFPKIGAAIATNKKRILGCEATIDNNVMGLVPTGQVVPEYLLSYMQGINLSDWASQAQPPSMRKSDVEAHGLPLPDKNTQQKVVAELEAERALVEASRKLAEIFEKKIQAKLAEIWGAE